MRPFDIDKFCFAAEFCALSRNRLSTTSRWRFQHRQRSRETAKAELYRRIRQARFVFPVLFRNWPLLLLQAPWLLIARPSRTVVLIHTFVPIFPTSSRQIVAILHALLDILWMYSLTFPLCVWDGDSMLIQNLSHSSQWGFYSRQPLKVVRGEWERDFSAGYEILAKISLRIYASRGERQDGGWMMKPHIYGAEDGPEYFNGVWNHTWNMRGCYSTNVRRSSDFNHSYWQ